MRSLVQYEDRFLGYRHLVKLQKFVSSLLLLLYTAACTLLNVFENGRVLVCGVFIYAAIASADSVADATFSAVLSPGFILHCSTSFVGDKYSELG